MLYFDLKSKVEQVRLNAIKDARALQGEPEEELWNLFILLVK